MNKKSKFFNNKYENILKGITYMDENKKEIPENEPAGEEKPIKSSNFYNEKQKKNMKRVKYAYAFAMVIALGTVLFAKIATEKALGNIAPIESEYAITTTEKISIKDEQNLIDDYEVHENLTNVPDTREETKAETKSETTKEPTTEKSPYAVPYKDYYTLPLGSEILRDYSGDAPKYNATLGDWRTHNGIDFKGTDGEPVKAVAYGVIKNIYEDTLLGTVVEIDHGNGMLARYCGFNKDTLEIKKGNKVESGGLLGYLGTVPFEKDDLPHLHFEVIYNGKNVEPMEVLGK